MGADSGPIFLGPATTEVETAVVNNREPTSETASRDDDAPWKLREDPTATGWGGSLWFQEEILGEEWVDAEGPPMLGLRP